VLAAPLDCGSAPAWLTLTGGFAWVYHVDHVLTEAENRAARRAIDAAYNDEPRVPFHQMVREEQRKMLQVVRDDETRTT
jgi:hypothetical protein